eukprot:CAMPEP_0181329930 /NCGR_PEP_ID=MMETSP1101-20121128/23600_1 /TAXON_ID=46948 /ORGANISM="Rhodomonas abbreviata, Strain Caron Lab Isolate" /LENGTH=140 /DNA_ID=CAMNT_0023439095 /DNA_START=179 /DNA_END=600 /DNA_ORIENTATION=+
MFSGSAMVMGRRNVTPSGEKSNTTFDASENPEFLAGFSALGSGIIAPAESGAVTPSGHAKLGIEIDIVPQAPTTGPSVAACPPVGAGSDAVADDRDVSECSGDAGDGGGWGVVEHAVWCARDFDSGAVRYVVGVGDRLDA